MILDVRNINKSFSGKQILFDVSFTVTAGKAMGFLGRNGAGKTTTIRTLMNVFKADSGDFLLDGKPFIASQHRVGYLPEERGLYGKEKILDQLIYFGTLRGASTAEARKSAEYWLNRFELTYANQHKLETLSKGNQQKVQIAQSLLNDPDIIILDEPFSGLDPVNSQVLKDVISEQIGKGKLVIFSSHQMNYVEEFCDEISLIDQGHIILSGNLKTIKAEMGRQRLRLSVHDQTLDELKKILNSHISNITINQDQHSLIIQLDEHKSKQCFLEELIQLKLDIDLFTNYEPSLNDIFVTKVGDDHA
ncbi:MAG: ATP-binding cassette domain-containing protein [Erysipelotrichaceae bacterium]|nr:ATP-binding cassette domain-containing protein [Erysipelotrichaceae bacterium]